MSEKEDFLVLLDEEGNEHKFEVVDFLQVDDNDYVILTSLDEEEFEEESEEDFEESLELDWSIDDEMEDSEEVVIFRIIEKGEEEQELVIVEDEEEWQNVVAAWDELE